VPPIQVWSASASMATGAPACERLAVRHHQLERLVQQVGALQLEVGLGQRRVVVDEGQVQLSAG
jgi:hypothetical protein